MMAVTINKTIQQAINEMKENKGSVIEHKWFEIHIYDNSWPNEYHVSVKDTSSDRYIYEANIWCKNDVMLYKNVEMVLEYLG